jgi:hypothetical protein
MKYALLDPILEELAKEGKIRIEEEMITLASPLDAETRRSKFMLLKRK